MKTKTRKIIEIIVNVILLIEFIILVAGGWVFSAIAYNKINKFEKQYQADMEEIYDEINEMEYFIRADTTDYRLWLIELEDRIEELEETIISSDYEKLQEYSRQINWELTIYGYILEAQHDLATGKITQEKYQERINDLNNQWNELKGE